MVNMSLTEILAVSETETDGAYIVKCVGDIGLGEETFDYCLTPGDTNGLAPVVRAAVEAWISDGKPVLPYEPPPVDLGDLKASLKAQIDADAEAERLKYITPGAGQAMAYLQKAMEATAYLGETDPDPADYPLLAAEVGITGDTIADVAAVVDAHYQAWRVIGAAIEQARLGGKAAVDAAETVEDAQAAYDAVTWPDPLSA